MNCRLCASLVLALCCGCSKADGISDACAAEVRSCFNFTQAITEEQVCLVVSNAVACIGNTGSNCQLEETQVTHRQLAITYNWSCNAIQPQLSSVGECRAAKNCVDNMGDLKAFGSKDLETQRRLFSQEALKTDFLCRLWVHFVGCYIDSANDCSQSPNDVKKVKEHLGIFKAVCDMRSATTEKSRRTTTEKWRRAITEQWRKTPIARAAMTTKPPDTTHDPDSGTDKEKEPDSGDDQEAAITLASSVTGTIALIIGIFIGFAISLLRRRGQRSGEETGVKWGTLALRHDQKAGYEPDNALYLTPCAAGSVDHLGDWKRQSAYAEEVRVTEVANSDVEAAYYSEIGKPRIPETQISLQHIYEEAK